MKSAARERARVAPDVGVALDEDWASSPSSTLEDERPLIDGVALRCHDPFGERRWTRASQALLALPAALLVLALLGGAALCREEPAPAEAPPPEAPPRPVATPPELTPRQLFESPRFAEVATDNALALARGAIGLHRRGEVRAHMDAALRNFSGSLWSRCPASGEKLDQILLTPEEQDALLTMMRSVSDPRVHRLGLDAGLALLGLQRGSGSVPDSDDAKRHLVNSFEPRLAEIQELRDEVIPEALRGPEDSSGPLSLALDPEGFRFMDTLHHWNVEVDVEVSRPDMASEAVAAALPTRRLGEIAGAETGGGAGKSGSPEKDKDDKSPLSSMLDMMRMQVQAEKFFNEVQAFMARKYSVHVPNMDEAFRGVDTSKVVTCAMEAAVSMNIKLVMQCGVEFWSIAMTIMQNIAHGIGPVTTSTEQTVFQSFDDVMD